MLPILAGAVALAPPHNVTHLDLRSARPVGSPHTYIKTTAVGNFPEGFAEESYNGYEGVISGADTSLTVSGNVRAYWVEDYRQHDWSQIKYKKLDLRGKSLRWTTDISKVGCACNAALYLVAMGSSGSGGSSGYCDIQGVGGSECLEIDLLEGNKKAIQTTLHTQTGEKVDGTCNQYGCAVGGGTRTVACSAPNLACPVPAGSILVRHLIGSWSRPYSHTLPDAYRHIPLHTVTYRYIPLHLGSWESALLPLSPHILLPPPRVRSSTGARTTRITTAKAR
jgi:hypothetical protein